MSADEYINQIKDELIRVRNPEFPQNYIRHIKENIGKVDIIFVSSHLNVRKAMEDAGIKYITIYPKDTMLNEWIGRMYLRGNDEKFIDFIIDNWDDFMTDIKHEPHGYSLHQLGHSQYIDEKLIDILNEAYTDHRHMN